MEHNFQLGEDSVGDRYWVMAMTGKLVNERGKLLSIGYKTLKRVRKDFFFVHLRGRGIKARIVKSHTDV